MREQLERRLQELKAEYKLGQTALAELQTQQANLQQTLLRISGAMQVLEEELAKAAPPARDGIAPAADIAAAPAEALTEPGAALSA